MCTNASIGSSFRFLTLRLCHQDVDATSDRAADSKSVDDAKKRCPPVDRQSGAVDGRAVVRVRRRRTSDRLLKPSAWQCGGDGIGIGLVAVGIRVKSVWIGEVVDERI
jgi:hypothetical protein